MLELVRGNALNVLEQELGQFDAVITDPPYASGQTQAEKQRPTALKYTESKQHCAFPDFMGDQLDQRAWLRMMRQVLEAARAKCVPGAVLAVFVDWRNLPLLTDVVQMAGWCLRGVAVWDKVTSRPQQGRFKQQAEFIVWGSNGRLSTQR